MKLIHSKLFHNVLLAAFSFVFSLSVSVVTYRYLWKAANNDFLVLWLVVFEASQLLLLLDFGFSHAFIKNCRDINNIKLLSKPLSSLRSVLMISAGIAFLISLIISFFVVANQVSFGPFVLLSFSIFVTIASYAETAALRVLNRNFVIYGANILGSILYLIIILFSGLEVELGIAVAALFRSCCQYLIQRFFLKGSGWFSRPNFTSFGSNVIALNFSYFSLFMLDGLVFSLLEFQGVYLATLILTKKLYDILRGLWDTVFNVFTVEYTRNKDSTRDLLIALVIVLSFVIMFLLSKIILQTWFEDFIFDGYLSLTLGLSVMSFSLYRNRSLRAYFSGERGVLLSALIILIIKGIFFYVLYLGGESFVLKAYFIQACFVYIVICCFGRSLKLGR